MEVRWFGEPWPSPERRAPVCADDAFRVDVPVGTRCLQCQSLIGERDRGVVTACSPSIFGHWRLVVEGSELPVCSYHLKCFLEEVVGGVMSDKIMARMRVEQREGEMLSASSETQSGGETPAPRYARPEPGSDDVEPGRGWRGERESS